MSTVQRQYDCNIFPLFVILTAYNLKIWFLDTEKKWLLFDIRYRVSTGSPQGIKVCL
jgi:hypothetical protein